MSEVVGMEKGRENKAGEGESGKGSGRFGNIKEKFNPKKVKKLSKKQLIIIGCATVAVIVAGAVVFEKASKKKTGNTEYEIATAEKRTIVRTVEASSIVEPNDSYNVTALVTGDILRDTFNEGDTVSKDQILYQIDSEEAQKKVDTAQNELAKAQQTFADAVKKKANTIKTNSQNEQTTQNSITKALENVNTANRNLATAQQDLNDLNIVSDYTGIISEVLVNDGDSVADGTKLAKIYDESKFKIRMPFNIADAETIKAGDTAELTIASSGEKLYGTVESVSSGTNATEAHAIVKYVTVAAVNPGALKAGEKASAVINNAACSDLGTFENYSEGYITSKTSGRIGELYLEQNDHITAGQNVGYIVSDNVQNSYKSAQSSVATAKLDLNNAYIQLEQLVVNNDTYSLDSSIKSAEISLDNARISLETAQKNLEDYTITAPIDGTIVTKNKKAGEKLEQNSGSSAEPMSVIYDMSVLKIQITVDETDIHDVAVEQAVKITADAVTGEFTGVVTKVGIDGTSSNGVTTYPVDIEVTEYGDLLPGMNVDCVIEVEKAEDVIAIPVQSLQRGNKVYVKGDKKDENDTAPDGFYSVDVVTGATDSMFIEIKDGLNEGDEICGAVKATGNEAVGQQEKSGMMGGMGAMGGGMPGGGMPGGGGGMSGGGPR